MSRRYRVITAVRTDINGLANLEATRLVQDYANLQPALRRAHKEGERISNQVLGREAFVYDMTANELLKNAS